jgi:HK97 gp10 family phage protein
MTDAMRVTLRLTQTADDAELARQIIPRMEALGQAVGSRMQRLVPKRSWALHDTISADTSQRGGKIVTAIGFGGGDVDYGLHVERGTSRMRAQPFARPAFAQVPGRDLDFSGKGITRHGVTTFSTRRTRLRSRGQR